jgi:hypothetical protein
MIFSLPFEVWSQIFEFLDETLSIWDGRTTLALASQTSRYLHAIIEPILYSRICIVLHPSFAFTLSCIPFINSKPRLAEAVRQLMIDGFSKNHIDEFSPGIDAAMSYHLHEVCRLIPRMTGLRKLTCNKTLYFPSLHSAVVSHPTLSVVTILSPRLVLPSHLRSPEQINYLSNLAVQHTAKVNSSYLQSFETNSSPIMRALSTSGAAANIRYATITICSEQDRLSISALLEQCVSLHHLRFIGLEHATRLCKTTLPNLRKFQGHPRDAVNLVPGRPVTELELFPTSDTPSWVTYGITCVTDAIAAAALSSIPLQYLSITLYDVREVTFHAIQGLFPNLLKLRVVFLNINPSPVVSEMLDSLCYRAVFTQGVAITGNHKVDNEIRDLYDRPVVQTALAVHNVLQLP